jgi:hypothetical protein
MTRFPLLLLVLVLPAWAAEKLPVEFDRPSWVARPAYLGNATSRPEILHADGVTTLRVIEDKMGMKFALPLTGFRTADHDYLVFRYKAGNLAGGYALWLSDDVQGGHELVNVRQLQQDGEWHVAAIDLFGSGALGIGRELLTEVQCRGDAAWIAFDWIRPADEAPAGADVFAKAKPTPDVVLRPATMPGLKAEPAWLSYDSPDFSAKAEDEGLHLHVTGATKGMKWSLPLAKPLDLEPLRYAAIRYRAQGVRKHGDYFVWLADKAGGSAPNSQSLLGLPALRSDGQWHVATVPLTKRFTAVEMALQNVSEGDEADIWLDEIRFSVRRPRFPVAKLCRIEQLSGPAMVPLLSQAKRCPALAVPSTTGWRTGSRVGSPASKAFRSRSSMARPANWRAWGRSRYRSARQRASCTC